MDDKKLLFIVNPRAGKTKSLAPLFDAAAISLEQFVFLQHLQQKE